MNCIKCNGATVDNLLYCYDCWKDISMDIESPYTRNDLREIEVLEMEAI